MSKAVLILAAVCCFLLVSSSISGGLYYFRCDLELVGCPSPETPSPSAPPSDLCKSIKIISNAAKNTFIPMTIFSMSTI